MLSPRCGALFAPISPAAGRFPDVACSEDRRDREPFAVELSATATLDARIQPDRSALDVPWSSSPQTAPRQHPAAWPGTCCTGASHDWRCGPGWRRSRTATVASTVPRSSSVAAGASTLPKASTTPGPRPSDCRRQVDGSERPQRSNDGRTAHRRLHRCHERIRPTTRRPDDPACLVMFAGPQHLPPQVVNESLGDRSALDSTSSRSRTAAARRRCAECNRLAWID